MPIPPRILLILERWLRTDIRYSATGGFFLGLVQIVGALTGLGLTIAFANLLPVETYGTYRYLLATYSIIAIAALPGLDASILQSVSRGFEGTFKSGVAARFRWGFVGTAIAIGYAAYHFSQGSLIMGALFIVAGLSLPFMESYAMYASFLNGKRLFKEWAAFDIISQIVSALVLIATMFFTKNILIIVSAYFIPYILTRFLITIFVYKRYVANNTIDPESLQYGKSMTLFQIISRLSASMDQIILYYLLGPAQVALFSLATAIPNRMQGMYRISGVLAFPKFANKSSFDIASTLYRKMFLFFIFILICGLAYAILAPFIFTYIFPQYINSIPYSQIVVFYTLSAITYPFAASLTAHKRVRDNYWIVILSFLVKFLVLVISIPFFGVWGAILGMLAASATTIAITFWFMYCDSNPKDQSSVQLQ